MGPVEGLEIALRREKESFDLYQQFAQKYPQARAIFEFLMNEEGKHRKLIEQEIKSLTKY